MAAKILIVDDDADLRRTFSLLLAPEFEVVEAADGAQALALLARHRFALALVDVSMPEMDGLQFLRASHDARGGMIVVMVTAEIDLDTAKAALGEGATSYVTKPCDQDYLRAEVRRLLNPQPEDKSGRPWRVQEGTPSAGK
jgi:DNA-binding NtrC family response regulator